MPLYRLDNVPWTKHRHITYVLDLDKYQYIATIVPKRRGKRSVYAVYIPASYAKLERRKPMRILIGETLFLSDAVKLAANNQLSWYEKE